MLLFPAPASHACTLHASTVGCAPVLFPRACVRAPRASPLFGHSCASGVVVSRFESCVSSRVKCQSVISSFEEISHWIWISFVRKSDIAAPDPSAASLALVQSASCCASARGGRPGATCRRRGLLAHNPLRPSRCVSATRLHASGSHCRAPHTLSNSRGPSLLAAAGPLARQRATRSSRDERRLRRVRSPHRSPPRRCFASHHRPGARRGGERGSARGRGPPPRGRSHGTVGAPARLPDSTQ